MGNYLRSCGFGEILFHGSHCYIIGRLPSCKIAEQRKELFLLHGAYTLNTCDLHGVFGYGSCFIHAKHICTGKGLDTFHIMHQHLLSCKAHCAYGKGNAGKQEEPFGYHSDNRRHCGAHALGIIHRLCNVHMVKLQTSKGKDYKSCDLYDLIQRAYHFRLFALFDLLCLKGELRDIRLCPHLGESCFTGAGHDKASAHELGALFLDDLIRLAGKQGFVGGGFAAYHNCVGRYLISGFEDHDIVSHKFFRGYALLLSVTDNFGGGRVKHGHFIKQPL